MSQILSAIAIILLIYLFYLYYESSENFVSTKAHHIYNISKNALNENWTYSQLKQKIIDIDPVLYTDVKKLWHNNMLSPENVQKII